MTKEIIKKITQPRTYLDSSDISAEEKKSLAEYLAKMGFTQSTFYIRFFQKGFSEWELCGVKECKNQFLELPEVSKLLLEFVEPDELPGNRGYFYTLAHSDEPGVFYQCLKRVNGGLCNKFIAFMDERGMSQGTVIKRFTVDVWRSWEISGIRTILNNYKAK